MTQHTIKIEITGDRASGKSLLLRRIKALLEGELQNFTMKIDDDRSDEAHIAFATLCDEDRHQLAACRRDRGERQ